MRVYSVLSNVLLASWQPSHSTVVAASSPPCHSERQVFRVAHQFRSEFQARLVERRLCRSVPAGHRSAWAVWWGCRRQGRPLLVPLKRYFSIDRSLSVEGGTHTSNITSFILLVYEHLNLDKPACAIFQI